MFLQSGVLTIRGSYDQGSYNQGFLQSGVLTIRGFYNQGFLQSGVLQSGVLTIRGSYNQGFLQSGVLTIRGLTIGGSYDQGFLQSGIQINVSYMTSLCPDVDIDRKILRSGVCVDREFSRPVRILCSNVEIDLTRSSTCLTWQVCGVLTLRGSYDQGFSQSGVQINAYYMTSLCPDVDIDRKILRSGVGVDRKFLHLKRIGCSDVDIDPTMSHPC